MEFNAEYDRLRALTDEALKACFTAACPQQGLTEAMRYSLLAGGKRVRPILVLSFCRAFGGDENEALPVACAVEMLHTYSLIHDDLPAMDNDALRRGNPTNHRVFGEWTAILAGDALQAEAFGLILRSPLPADTRALCAAYLAEAAGVNGICGGQYLDMRGGGSPLTERELREIIERKTASLLAASCRMGAVLGGADEKGVDAAACYGTALGTAFQIRDDYLDVLGRTEELGKSAGSDEAGGKPTFMSLFGREKCETLIDVLTDSAKHAVASAVPEAGFLCWLAGHLAGRTK
jgi:geranylgeranyl diphosphate synthase type II